MLERSPPLPTIIISCSVDYLFLLALVQVAWHESLHRRPLIFASFIKSLDRRQSVDRGGEALANAYSEDVPYNVS